MHTFGAGDDIGKINLQVVYYIAQDAEPLPDWRERVEYHVSRAVQFHHREFSGQSIIHEEIFSEPFVSDATHAGFPNDDPNHFFWHVINEVWHSEKVQFKPDMFPILLVFSDMNFCPSYDDWTRECSGELCPFDPPHSDCRGWVLDNGEDRPGSRCGGARAVYWPDRHIGLGLVTADGWRVPIKGTDCVVYHEGVGHSIGLPHPEPSNNSVMSLAQYVDTIQKTWVDEDQKLALGWDPQGVDREDLFSTFSLSHTPAKPCATDTITLRASLSADMEIESITAEIQTSLANPFRSIAEEAICLDSEGMRIYQWKIPAPEKGESLAYRVRVKTLSGENEEIWNYLKVRDE